MKIADELIPMFLIDVMEDGEAAASATAPGGTTISQNNLGQVLPTYFPKFIKKRKKLIEPYKNFRKSKYAEKGWRSSKYAHLKGIRKTAKSWQSKKFHQKLGKWLVDREQGHVLNRFESADLVSVLSSFRTHVLLELNYYKPLSEEVDFFNAVEVLIKMIDEYSKEILESVYNYNEFEIKEDLYDNIVRILEPAGVIHSFALKSGKTEAEVEKLWQEAQDIVKDEYKKSEDDEGYWALVTGTLKKSLGLKEEDKKVND